MLNLSRVDLLYRFIEYMLEGKILLDYTNLFSPNDYENKEEVIYK